MDLILTLFFSKNTFGIKLSTEFNIQFHVNGNDEWINHSRRVGSYKTEDACTHIVSGIQVFFHRHREYT